MRNPLGNLFCKIVLAIFDYPLQPPNAKEKEYAEEMAKRIEGVKCTLKGKVIEENKLYGSVTVRDIQTALAAQGIEVEKNMILLADPIKTLGTYQIPIRVYKGVKPQIIVDVVSE